ncbi:MAG: hypothetical protein K9J16_05820 [Melioribacteraceae bacterium]|nr:hypothetical protein [Melioribacteraceae bacterium]MCF8355262.1 hypothetical protein [Melioribacteraceae bacterium]MCF8394161.1 hypothetical protein [Melioribacteraceae bacterium]MCF8418844.1 hypothetical protein [Melioribacteraceae bacterium]
MKKMLIMLFLSLSIFGQEKNELSGNIILDNKIAFNNTFEINQNPLTLNSTDEKSPFLAGLLSFAVPGAGDFYAENYIMSAVFLAAEAAGITFAVMYDKKGDEQTVVFENYANENWSVKRYANWTVENSGKLNPGIEPENPVLDVFDNSGNVIWSKLNKLEQEISKGELGGYYSHRLAPYGDQQYYEMIGKYPQFNVGWEEFGNDPTKPYLYGDPLVDQFHYYSEQRGKANDFYNVAKWAVIGVVTNHIISALNAAWSASRYNKEIDVNMSLEKENIGFAVEYYPQLNIKYHF